MPPRHEDRTLSLDEEGKLQGIVEDFSSDVTAVRREARRSMSSFLAELPRPKSATATSRLLQNLPFKSYRFQLGMATALAGLPGPVAVSNPAAARTELRSALAAPAGRDPTLRKNLDDALKKIPRA